VRSADRSRNKKIPVAHYRSTLAQILIQRHCERREPRGNPSFVRNESNALFFLDCFAPRCARPRNDAAGAISVSTQSRDVASVAQNRFRSHKSRSSVIASGGSRVAIHLLRTSNETRCFFWIASRLAALALARTRWGALFERTGCWQDNRKV